MKQQLSMVSLIVRDYEEAIHFYTQILGFALTHDEPLSGTKRWVVVTPPGSVTSVLLAKATGPGQTAAIGNQTGGRVFLFLYTDDFERDHQRLIDQRVVIVRPPVNETYGRVLVFEDLYGNLWDLIEPLRAPE